MATDARVTQNELQVAVTYFTDNRVTQNELQVAFTYFTDSRVTQQELQIAFMIPHTKPRRTMLMLHNSP